MMIRLGGSTGNVDESECQEIDSDDAGEPDTYGCFCECSDGSTSNSQISLIEAEGNVLLTTPTEIARGNTGTYDVRKKKAILIGAVVLTQGENVLHGEKLVMDLNTGHSRLEGTAGSAEQDGDGRVKAIFNPETAEEQ